MKAISNNDDGPPSPMTTTRQQKTDNREKPITKTKPGPLTAIRHTRQAAEVVEPPPMRAVKSITVAIEQIMTPSH